MATARQDIARIDDLPQAIMKNGASIRHTLGESRRMIARLNQSLVPVATGSMEALWTIAWWDLGELELACKYLDSGPFQSEYDTLRIVAELGDPTKAEVLLRDYLANHSQSTMWSRRYAPLLRGEFALMAHKPQEALVLMEPARQYDDASHDGYYLRGLAYMQANQLPQAEAEFRNLLAHAYIEPTGSSLPLAQLQLARILAREGNRAASAEAYRRFLDAWKNGDPGRPLVLAARKELKALEDGKCFLSNHHRKWSLA